MAYPDCLSNLVGLRYCDAEAPTSEHYINELEGIELQFIADLATGEKKTFKGVWDDVVSRTLLKFPGEVMEEMKKCYKVKSLDCVRDIICEFNESLTLVWMYRLGKELMIERLYSNSWNRWTQTRDEATEAFSHYESNFKTNLAQWVAGLHIDPCDRPECFQCGGSVVHRGVMLP